MKFENVIKMYLYGGSLFMLAESIYHFSGIRLADASNWPMSAQSFSYFYLCLWGSASLLIALLLFSIARNKELQRVLLPPLALFSLFHAIILLWWSFQSVQQLWEYPSLYFWNPVYDWQLKLEAVVLLSFSLLVASVWWNKKSSLLK